MQGARGYHDYSKVRALVTCTCFHVRSNLAAASSNSELSTVNLLASDIEMQNFSLKLSFTCVNKLITVWIWELLYF